MLTFYGLSSGADGLLSHGPEAGRNDPSGRFDPVETGLLKSNIA